MNLLERIARSNGDSQRTIAALRLINDLLKQKVASQAAGFPVASNKDNSHKREDTVQLTLVLEPDYDSPLADN